MKNLKETAGVAASNLKEVLSAFCSHPRIFNDTADTGDANDDFYEALGNATTSLEILETLAAEDPLNHDLLSEAVETVNNHVASFQSFLKEI